jgi:RimJ/RimL family protein N-acetyltransferase
MSGPLTDGVVTLRPWRDEDAGTMVECLDGDEEIARWLDRIPQPYTVEDALAYIACADEEKYAITDASGGRVVGSIGLRWNATRDVAEAGYWVRADARGRGFTTRALVLATRHALATGAARVELRADVENLASCRVAEKAGFTREGVLRASYWNPRLGRRQDLVMYSVLAGE